MAYCLCPALASVGRAQYGACKLCFFLCVGDDDDGDRFSGSLNGNLWCLSYLVAPVPCALVQGATGRVSDIELQWRPESAVTVVVAANGYPGQYRSGTAIRGIENVTTAKVRAVRQGQWKCR